MAIKTEFMFLNACSGGGAGVMGSLVSFQASQLAGERAESSDGISINTTVISPSTRQKIMKNNLLYP